MSTTKFAKPQRHFSIALLEEHSFVIGLTVRLILMYALPRLMDDGLLLQGVRYTDIDYDVFTDAAEHIAHGRSPYARHTYRYTPFLAKFLALPLDHKLDGNGFSFQSSLLSTKYFGKFLFCIADAICGYIIALLRRRQRASSSSDTQQPSQTQQPLQKQQQKSKQKQQNIILKKIQELIPTPSAKLVDALWWLYNPLPINICTRGSAESLVVLLPVLITVALVNMYQKKIPLSSSQTPCFQGTLPIRLRACLTGILHGIAIHAKLYPVIYTVSIMAAFARQEQQRILTTRKSHITSQRAREGGWLHNLSDYLRIMENCFCCALSSEKNGMTGFPWKHPLRILTLAALWVERLFFTLSSVLFLILSLGTMAFLTYLSVHFYGRVALDEGLLYHFQRVDHRHNYSIYWYWIYLARGRASEALNRMTLIGTGASEGLAKTTFSPQMGFLGHIPLIPQIIILGFTSLGIAPYDMTLALFCQTFAFVAFNKVTTAQYFTWYLCLLPLCADRIQWRSKRMILSLTFLFVSIATWLLSAFTLEMLGWTSHRQVWLASVLFFIANVNLLSAILNGYKKKKTTVLMSTPGAGWATGRNKAKLS